MIENEKELVSFERFVALLNMDLKSSPSYQDGMEFTNICTGYEFIAPMLSGIENHVLDKLIFDQVSANYTIAR